MVEFKEDTYYKIFAYYKGIIFTVNYYCESCFKEMKQ